MRHHAFAAAMGLFTAAAVLAPCGASQAAGADPTGYWYKPDAERESKIQVRFGIRRTQFDSPPQFGDRFLRLSGLSQGAAETVVE